MTHARFMDIGFTAIAAIMIVGGVFLLWLIWCWEPNGGE